MRLIDDQRALPVRSVTAYLTAEELRELYEQLAYLVREEGIATDPEWHTHLSSHDGRSYELTLGLLEAVRPGLEEKWARFINDDIWPKPAD